MIFIKKNKTIIIAVVLYLILVLLGVRVKNILIPNEGAAVYGNRLEGKVAITKNADTRIKESLEHGVSSVKVRNTGRIINIMITVNDDVSKQTSKEYAVKALEVFTKEEKEYYDFQFFIEKEKKEATDFPIIGYRIRNSEKTTWTKDR